MTPPVLFVSHGAPNVYIDETPAHLALRALGRTLARPRAVLIVSAHWETAGPAVDVSDWPATIHDFSGFPPALSRVRYDAPGAPDVAGRVFAMMAAAGLTPEPPRERGRDHGAWVPAALMWPEADVPGFQVSVCPARDAAWHRRLGGALAPLRDEGVLIMGSGAVTHNLRAVDFRNREAPTPDWVDAFADWTAERVAAGQPVDDWLSAPEAARNHPTPEHFLPLAVAQGAAGAAPGRLVHGSTDYGVLRMDIHQWD
ncbi:DODA-type extradiol aromatic ring-opening family dioxygenase [Caenispirillum salinarum]|uniref:DODA-type extradiol aromatic ring-opening family dioxygenase n=1 Tax=Caenispirillum salinarum TaxID=859058 RepID=UPI0038510E81